MEKEAPSVTEKSYVITSRVSLSPLSAVWLAEVVSSVSLGSSTKKLVESSRFSWRM